MYDLRLDLSIISLHDVYFGDAMKKQILDLQHALFWKKVSEQNDENFTCWVKSKFSI